MAAPARSAPARGLAPPRRGVPVWLLAMTAGAVLALATSIALLVGLMLLPGLLVMVVDREPGKPLARGLLIFGLAAITPELARLWHTGHPAEAAWSALSDYRVLAIAWAAQAGGWLLGELVQLAIRAGLELRSAARARLLQAERTRLRDAWDFGAPKN